ncbi:MAG: anaerobic ribonucleoside-triphosphate reductase activating protein [Oscillospiraceae bacterium]|nr:anaerobic ribonucleoside-triphosphate reductase activating protein [Oscillospiraceae bacterium]
MKISGFQKLTLLDFPHKTACTVFTHGCNFRCPFCHNASLVTYDAGTKFTEDEVLAHLEKRKGVLDGICISGGEPLLQSSLFEFIQKAKSMGYLVKLDTNGSYYARLEVLVKSGLVDYVAMDIKNSPQKYAASCGLESMDFENIEKSKELLIHSGIEYEFRTTVVKQLHTEEDFEQIGEFIKGAKRYYLQKFIDSGDIICSGLGAHDDEYMKQCLEVVRKYVPTAQLRGV